MNWNYFKGLQKYYTLAELIQKALADSRATPRRNLLVYCLGYSWKEVYNSDSEEELKIALSKNRYSEAEPLVDRLVRALEDPDYRIREEAVVELCHLGRLGLLSEDDKIVDALIKVLREKELWVFRGDAVILLSQLGKGRKDDKIVDALIETLQKDQERRVRLVAVNALSQLGQGREDDKIVDVLIGALQKDQDSEVRRNAVKALGELGQGREDDKIVDVLIGALQKDQWVRQNAVKPNFDTPIFCKSLSINDLADIQA